MSRYTAYAVFDESGDAGQHARSSKYLVVVALVSSNLEPLRKVIHRVRQKMPETLRGNAELHAFETPEAARPVLKFIAATDVRIYAAVVDKQKLGRQDSVDVLTLAYTACTAIALEEEGGIIATIDRPFNSARQRQHLIDAMADTAEELNKRLVVVMEDSRHEKALQAADIVAWAVFQKHEREEEEFVELIHDKIAHVMMLP